MRTRELVALVWGVEAGRVRQDARTGRLGFSYDEAWRARADSVPLSLSMPLAAKDHGHDAVDAFLWGLLPDNETVLDRWARRFHVSSRNAFAIVSEVGEDCAGAVQFAAPDRVDALRGPGGVEVEWLDEGQVEARLRGLGEDQAAWRMAGDQGRFSLAGSRPKTALLHTGGRWGVPAGRTPTTHILKPPLRGLDGHVENEHLCLRLARAAGLAAAGSDVVRFGVEIAIAVERYDRIRTPDPAGTQPVLRLHQEDLCQALGVRPTLKYQNEGGPAPAGIVDLLREHSSSPEEDVAAFVDALAFNWLIGGTDGHAKNYSLLHGGGGRVRLAPLYDLASVLPCPGSDPRRAAMAMRIGGKYRLHEIRKRQWISLAEELGLDPDGTVRRIAELAAEVGGAIPEVRARAAEAGLDHPIVARFAELVAERASGCARDLR